VTGEARASWVISQGWLCAIHQAYSGGLNGIYLFNNVDLAISSLLFQSAV
jgi:hypothetical protein